MISQMLKSILSSRAKSRIKRAFGTLPELRLLREIEAVEGKLDSALRRQCDDYAQDTLGGKEYSPWLYVYALISGEFKEGWIPDNYYSDRVIPAWKGKYGDVSNLNALQCLLGLENFPDVLYRVNGIYILPDRSVLPLARAREHLSSYPEGVAFKADDGMQGRAIKILKGGEISGVDLASLPNGVFQRYIESNAELAKFHPDSVATVRMTTVIDEAGRDSLRAAYVRFGSGVDTHVKSATHVRVPVDLDSGRLSDVGYTTSWHRIGRHPDSQVVFSGAAIPGFSACIDLVSRAHRAMPFARCIGWDIAVDSSETPFLLEWNGAHNDIKFSEATQGPCFLDLGWETLWRE